MNKLPSSHFIFSVFTFYLLSNSSSAAPTEGLLSAVITGRASDVISSTFGSMMTSINTCVMGKSGWKDSSLGDFTRTNGYCEFKCLRSFLCCAPEKLDQLQIQFLLSLPPADQLSNKTGENSLNEAVKISYGDKKARNVLAADQNKTVVFIVHGFLNHYVYENLWNDTAIGYLNRGHPVVLVDWSRGNRLYHQAMANVRVVGSMLGQIIEYLGIADRSLCVGFSLGAHICGEAGTWLKQKHDLVLARCHGIDPAGPGFDGCSNDIRLDPSDCGLVTAVHSSQFVEMLGFGTKYKTGHCDFWMNEALNQPDCTSNPSFSGLMRDLFYGNIGQIGLTLEQSVGCAHLRSMKYYISQVNGSCNFVGRKVKKCGLGKPCVHSVKDLKGTFMPLPPDDLCKSGDELDFVVETTGSDPFC